MTTRRWVRMLAVPAFVLAGAGSAPEAGELREIHLPAPRTEGGKPLMEALGDRQSGREFGPETLPLQTVSDLLWAAAGINRPESGKRTAPSARNWQEVEVYVVLEEGAYRYDAADNTLRPVAAGDLRGATGSQDFVASAPLNLVYVADTDRMDVEDEELRTLYAAADTGFMSQNVYLFCASEGLATVVRGSVDREAVAAALGLPGHKRVVLAQTVGYPAAREGD